jgi:carbonic anhydrase
MSTYHFERARQRWLQALIFGLILALGGASIGCGSKAAEADKEAKDTAGKKKTKAKKPKAKSKEGEENAAETAVTEKAGKKSKDAAAGDTEKESKSGKHKAPASSMSASQALEQLKAGNDAYRNGQFNISHLTGERRSELAGGQQPFAIILSCADSRVPPELVFAQGLGDLFAVRVAGNIAEPATVASIEYAAAHLGSPLIVVMGHTECGAVKAAIAGASDTPSITQLVKAIQPALDGLPKEALKSDTERAIRANVSRASAELLSQSPLLNGLVKEGKLKVAEAVYDLKTGQVKFAK